MTRTNAPRIANVAPALAAIALAATLGACASSSDQANSDQHANANDHVRLIPLDEQPRYAPRGAPASTPIALGSGDRLGRTLFERHRATGLPSTNSFAAVRPD